MKKILIMLLVVCLLTSAAFAKEIKIITVDSSLSVREMQKLADSYKQDVDQYAHIIENSKHYTFSELLMAFEEWEISKAYYTYYSVAVEQYWKAKMDEYPVATTIWRYLTEELEFSDYVAAGIMGNMMVESGGHSLNIDPYNWDDATGRSFYGICQWGRYYPEIHNQGLEEQLKFLGETIEDEFTMMGFSYSKFLSTTSVETAARTFCRAYERPPAQYENPRVPCAYTAYDYFAGN